MQKSNHEQIRALLRRSEDGLTVTKMGNRLGRRSDSLRESLASMPDAYIDRWEKGSKGTWAAVWMVVVPPPNCPKPEASK